MAIRKAIQIGHPALKAINQEIVEFADYKLIQLVQDLRDTMYSAKVDRNSRPSNRRKL